MANVFKKAANYLGLVDQDEDFDLQTTVALPQDAVRRNVRAVPHVPSARASFTPAATTSSTSAPVQAAPRRQVAVAPVVTEQVTAPVEMHTMDQIYTIHPRFYNEARSVGERYREGQPVLMNLTDMEESERKRLVDFASGLVFGHHGSIERVTSKVFLLTPPNVRVQTESKSPSMDAHLFNQS